MSPEERDWLNWLKRARDGKMRQWEAAEQMGVSDRWVRKLLQRTKRQGAAAVVHGLRGGPSNRKRAVEIQRQTLAILKQPDWHDFGPTFAAEQLAKRHQIQVGKETLRGWMIQAGLWKSKSGRARITTPVAKAPGCKASSIVPPRPCGARSDKTHAEDAHCLWPKASAREFHQQQKVVLTGKALRAIESLWRACAECFRS